MIYEMRKEENISEDKLKWHRQEAVACFNATWDLIDKVTRSKREDNEMIHLAHASVYHWSKVGEPVNIVRGEWQISRVSAMLNREESALKHAEYALEICEKENITGFDLAFIYEALARAYMVKGDKIKMDQYINLASRENEKTEKKEDKDYLFSELNTITMF